MSNDFTLVDPAKQDLFVLLVNDGEEPFIDRFAGKAIEIPPGKALRCPNYVAKHFIGDPAVIGGDDKQAAAAEQKRVYLRYAAFKPEDRDKKMPKLRSEPRPDEKEYVVTEAPAKKGRAKAKAPEQDEESFPDLKK